MLSRETVSIAFQAFIIVCPDISECELVGNKTIGLTMSSSGDIHILQSRSTPAAHTQIELYAKDRTFAANMLHRGLLLSPRKTPAQDGCPSLEVSQAACIVGVLRDIFPGDRDG